MARKTRLERAKPADTALPAVFGSASLGHHDEDPEATAKMMAERERPGERKAVMVPGQDYVAALGDGTFEVVVAGHRIRVFDNQADAELAFNAVVDVNDRGDLAFGPLGRELHQIPIEWVSPGPWLHRKEINVEALTGLADSIRQDGIRIPLEAVRKAPTEFLLFSGLRRYRAAGVVGLSTLPVIVYRELPDDVATRYSILENLHREDLSPMDTAHALAKLRDQGMDQEEISRALGKTQGWVSQYLSLLRLPSVAHKALEEKKISFSEARELERVADEPDTIKGILSKEGKALQKRIGHVPETVSERVSRVLEAKAREDKLAAKVQKLKDDGATFVEDYGGYEDKSYVRLDHWTNEKALHDKAGLACLVYTVYQAGILELCNDPKALAALKKAEEKARSETAYDREQREQRERQALQHQAITSVLRAWWDAKTPVGQEEVALYVSQQLAKLDEYWGKDPLDRMAEIMGLVEKKAKKEDARNKLKSLVFSPADGGELLRYWWLYVMVGNMDPMHLAWLKTHGYVDPTVPAKEQVSANPVELALDGAHMLADELIRGLDTINLKEGGLQLFCRDCQYQSPESSPAVIRKELEEHLGHWCELRYSLPAPEEEAQEQSRMAMEQIDAELSPNEQEMEALARMDDLAREMAPELFAEAPDA